MSTGWTGIYKGIVTNNEDPEGFSRVKAICPQVFGNSTTETGWAWPVSPPSTVAVYSGGGAGVVTSAITTPNPSGSVWLAFEGGDTEHPMWLGTWI